MRVVKEILKSACKITIFEWNEKYLIKLEQDNLEQTFKIDKYEIVNEGQLEGLLSEEFMERAMKRFHEMAMTLSESVDNL